jgi:hypothetical protein
MIVDERTLKNQHISLPEEFTEIYKTLLDDKI